MKENYFKNLFDLKGKNVIVTGACGILGEKFCRGLAEYGATIAVVDIDINAAIELSYQLSDSYNITTKAFYCDVSNADSVATMVDEVSLHFGAIHVLLNNVAAKSQNLDDFFANFENYELSEWKAIMSVNLDGVFLVAQAVGKHMINNNILGSIIQTASIYGVLAPDQRIYQDSFYLGTQINSPCVYAASKSAIIGMTKYLAAYWGAKIRVNSISPGGVESGQNEIFKEKYSNRVPMNRMAKPEEIVGSVIFLASDASSYITGQNIIIDGGLSSW